ncbi:MAG TPA: BTAD domain-containing putative transcriptional regulator [Actinophytocola sp.]|uniref:AfsR/SARP family transcriptional regulator n=1 Tax=Actinophytocola sp. TaxID=1872138 RepID=UPI002DBA4C1D|nr:BTAD domain-containing putative transcriptional regulator [Actinophytocola sp.]HEU5469090.1 BTAD domain-containing putative transcriptional regulator [Actinophytocola sp.]
MEVRLLGEVQLWAAGQLLDVGAPRQQAVLAVLSVDAGRPVAMDTLIDRVWDDTPPVEARNVLYSHLSRIRRLLGQAADRTGQRSVRIERRHAGYILDIDPDVVDLHRFCRLVEHGCDPWLADTDRAGALTAALRLWRGPPLAVLSGRWAAQVRSSWHQHRLEAAAQWAQVELRLGHPSVVITALHDLVAEYPLAEQLEGLLMRALHAAGRSAEALDRYTLLRQRLADDLGTDPGPELRTLHQCLLRGEPPPATPEPTITTSGSAPDNHGAGGDRHVGRPHPHELPRDTLGFTGRDREGVSPRPAPGRASEALPGTSLVGRQRELAQVLTLLAGNRLVTLTGPGGCGKTRLATTAMHLLLDAYQVMLVDLTPVRVPELVTETVATALGAPEQPGIDRVDTLVEGLADQDLIVVLDNCEHLVRAAAELVSRLLARCPKLVILATSREALRLAGEATYAVPPLATPDPDVPRTLAELAAYDSVRLFLDRAAEHAGLAFDDDDAQHIAALCAALDGLPLAIELAAARTPVLAPAQIVRRLQDRFGLLSFRGRVASADHHQALDAALAWSHDLLSGDEASLFARLGVFVGGFSVEGAEAVWQPAGTLDALTGLVAKSLVRAGRTGASTRFFMLETIAAFARTKLAADPEAEATTRERHAGFFLTWAEDAALDPTGAGFSELRVEFENLRAAMGWFAGSTDCTDELRMATVLSRYCRLHGHYREGRQWLVHALARSEGASADLRVKALTGAASLALSECDYERASRHAAQALELATVAGDQGQAGRVLVLLGAVARERADYRTALDHYHAAASAFHADGDQAGVAYSRQLAGATLWQAGDLDAASVFLTESLVALRERGDRRGAASSLAYLGAVALYRDDRPQARRLLDQALDVFGELEFKEGIAWALNLLGLVEHGDGNHNEAGRILRASLALHRDLGDRWRQASVLEALAAVAFATGDVDQAAWSLRQADEIRTAIDAPVPFIERAALARTHDVRHRNRQLPTDSTRSLDLDTSLGPPHVAWRDKP